MDWIQLVFLSLVQGLTEFLPISSSAHLVLPAQLTDWPDQGLAFDVGVHFGTLLAVLVYFRTELTAMASSAWRFPAQRHYDADLDMLLKLTLATLPVLIVGLLGKEYIETHLRSVPVIATTTMVFALVLWFADRRPGQLEMPDWRHTVFIGLAQTLALVPGTSRSGITITAALLAGLSRTGAARFSFLLAIPTIAGAQLLLSLELMESGMGQAWVNLISGALIAGIAAYLCIRFFIALVERTGMLPYVVYRLVLGAVLFVIYFS